MKIHLPWKTLAILLVFISLSACNLTKDSGAILAFYNVENLFDTVNDPFTNDDEFTPQGELRWDQERYDHKSDQLAKVIDELGHPEILGLAEVENKKVLEELCRRIDASGTPYTITHFDSPDPRGIDVALLHKSPWKSVSSDTISVNGESLEAWRSRDILHVTLKDREGLSLHVFVNHWPSRSGGVQSSEPKRLEASRRLADSIRKLLVQEPDARIVVMGDFNDLPEDRSLTILIDSLLDQQGHPVLFNPSSMLQKTGEGSYNFRGNWQMIDQILLSVNMTQGKRRYRQMGVHKREWMMYQDKRNGAVPSRTYGGTQYFGGISDHLPVYVRLSR